MTASLGNNSLLLKCSSESDQSGENSSVAAAKNNLMDDGLCLPSDTQAPPTE